MSIMPTGGFPSIFGAGMGEGGTRRGWAEWEVEVAR